MAKINGVDLDLTQVKKMDMVIASYEAINGNNEKLYNLFIANVCPLSKETQLHYIDFYCIKDLAQKLKAKIN